MSLFSLSHAFAGISGISRTSEQVSEQLLAANQAFFAHLQGVFDTAISGTEKLAALNLATSRSTLREQLGSTQSWLEARDLPHSLSRQQLLLQSLQPNLEQALGYWRSLYAIATETQESWTKLAESQQSEINKSIATLLDQLSQGAPAGSEVAVSAVRSALSAANSAFENVNKAARQVAEITEASVNAATSATVRAVNSGTPAANPSASRKKAA